MANNNPSIIPNSLRNKSKEFPYIGGAIDVFDESLERDQQDINADTYRKGEVYTKNEVYNKNETYDRDHLYTKTEVNDLVSPTDQQYVNVSATASTETMADVEALIAATGEGENAGTIYRVGNWDGGAYNTLVYTEYGYADGSYVSLATKNLEQSNIRMSEDIPGLLESVLSTVQPNVSLDDDTGCIEMVYEFA